MRADRDGRRPPLALAALAGAAALLSCTYAPDFKDGTLLCGSMGSCPKGYHCVAGHTCYKEGNTPNDGGGGTPITSRNDVLGTWDFSSGTLDINCTDNTMTSRGLQGPNDHVEVSVGSGNNIAADFYCNWALDLTISPGKAEGKLQAGQQTCMSPGGCSDFTWTGRSFDFIATDSVTASVDGKVDATYKDYTDVAASNAAGKPVCLPKATTMPATGSCTLTVKGMLAKE